MANSEQHDMEVIATSEFYNGLKKQKDLDSIVTFFNSQGIQMNKVDLKIIAAMVSEDKDKNNEKRELSEEEIEYVSAGKLSPAAVGLLKAAAKGGLIGAGALGAAGGLGTFWYCLQDTPSWTGGNPKFAAKQAGSILPYALGAGAMAGTAIGAAAYIVKTAKKK